MSAQQPAPSLDLTITGVGQLAEEFTAAGIWVFFRDDAPEELTEFALLHRAPAPRTPLAAGDVLEIDGERFTIQAVGEVANDNVRELGHLVLKANGLTDPELPGDVCVEARPLPEPAVGMRIRIWGQAEEKVA